MKCDAFIIKTDKVNKSLATISIAISSSLFIIIHFSKFDISIIT